MNNPRFLFDEHIEVALLVALRQREPLIDILQVGDSGAPPRQTTDPDLLLAAESMSRILVSGDRRTMPVHLTHHFQAGRHTCGVILMRGGFSLARYTDE